MPDKTLKVVTYAAGASLAAITLIYVFGPTYFLDSDPSRSSNGAFSSRKSGGVVGLSNPANDCFINSVLQALAGLGDLRLYLIREIHRRTLDDDSIYTQSVPPGALAGKEADGLPPRFSKDMPEWKLEGLQTGTVTKSLKDILDALNERPLYKKIISAAPFVRALEEAFRQRVSRQQQDAQEFLQIVAERLCDEYHAGRRARLFARQAAYPGTGLPSTQPAVDDAGDVSSVPLQGMGSPAAATTPDAATGPGAGSAQVVLHKGEEEEEGFPLEGRFESQIECLTCGFKPRPTESTFCTLTLNVPQTQATTLSACFDGMFKTEYIDDFKCEKCRLLHAVTLFESEARRSTSEVAKAKAEAAVKALRDAIETDPEKPPVDITLPDMRFAPRRRIARHIRLTAFPKILAVHLSRSIFDASRHSLKNSAKVAFPERLPLGGLLQQRKYVLLGVVTHKGSHHSGHYESFRRQNMYPPFSNPGTFQPSGAYSKAASPASTPRSHSLRGEVDGDALTPPRYSLASESGPNSSRPSLDSAVTPVAGSSVDRTGVAPATASPRPNSSRIPSGSLPPVGISKTGDDITGKAVAPSKHKQRKPQARWWRISDDKVKEATTRDVLSMQREVYLLFYELEKASA
jgi:ubiquitin carboxyl-terminal hydrolase 16